MTMAFKKAERKRAKLRLALSGPSGSGKTFSALLVAKGMGGRIAVIDTEQGSASLYSHIAEFDALELSPPYTPERYITAIQAAVQGGYDVLVIDSMTHEWDGAGGCLEANETLAHARMKGNTWAAWNETTPRHRAFVDCILQSPIHIIATIRSKTETVQGADKKVVKLGMKTIQRDGTDYEFTTVLDLTHENHFANASKDRTGLFANPELLTEATGRKLLDWLNSGAEATPEPPAEQPPPSPASKAKPAPPATLRGLWAEMGKKSPGDGAKLIAGLAFVDGQLVRLLGGEYTPGGLADAVREFAGKGDVAGLADLAGDKLEGAWNRAKNYVKLIADQTESPAGVK